MRDEPWIHTREAVVEFLPTQFPWIDVNVLEVMLSIQPFKDFQSDQIYRRSRKIFTAHYACRNADVNLTPFMGTTNGFIFQIINSLIES